MLAQVETGVALAAVELAQRRRGVPLVEVHGAARFAALLVEPVLTERALGGGIGDRLRALGAQHARIEIRAERRVRQMPGCLVGPVGVARRGVQHDEPPAIQLGVLEHPFGRGALLRGEPVGVVIGRRDQDHQRLRPGAEPGPQRVVQLTVGLGQQLVNVGGVRADAERAERVASGHSEKRRRLLVDDPARAARHGQPPREHGRELHHPRGGAVGEPGLIFVEREPVNLGGVFVVGAQQVQHEPGDQLGFPVLAGRREVQLAVSADVGRPDRVVFDGAEERHDHVVALPVGGDERPTRRTGLWYARAAR